MTIFFYLFFNLQKIVAEQNLEDTRQQLLAARSSQAKAIDVLETRVLILLSACPMFGWNQLIDVVRPSIPCSALPFQAFTFWVLYRVIFFTLATLPSLLHTKFSLGY